MLISTRSFDVSALILIFTSIYTIQVKCSVDADHLKNRRILNLWKSHKTPTASSSSSRRNEERHQQTRYHHTHDLFHEFSEFVEEEKDYAKKDSFKKISLFGRKEKNPRALQTIQEEARDQDDAVINAEGDDDDRDDDDRDDDWNYYDECHFPGPFEQDADWWFENPLYSSAFNCDIVGSVASCDFSAAIPMLRGLCELVGGTFYTLSLSSTCPPSEYYYYNTSSFEWNITQLPYCAANCNIDDLINEEFVGYYEGCTTDISDVVTFDPIIDAKCKEETMSFSEAAGYGNPDYVFQDARGNAEYFINDHYISRETPGAIKESYDFKKIAEKIQGPCEEEGGVLYTFSEKRYQNNPYSNMYKIHRNVPFCIGSSCDESLIEEVLKPYRAYTQSYFFSQKDRPDILLYQSAFDLFEYKAISKTTELPSMAPSAKPEEEPKYGKFALRRRANGDILLRTCNWLSKKSEKLKRKFCRNKRYQFYPDKYLPASIKCFTTCAPYCIEESRNSKFLLRTTIDADSGQEVARTRQCKWLKQQNSEKIDSICSTHISANITINVGYGQASEVCTETCSNSPNTCSVSENPPVSSGCNVTFEGLLGDTLCDGGAYNTPECDYDGGDCLEFNDQYPLCDVPLPYVIGDGFCDGGGIYNTSECGFDGGDCPSIEGYPNCTAPIASYLGDGYCLGSIYNTLECGYDLGDCSDFNAKYPQCIVPWPEYVGNGYCETTVLSYITHNKEECGYEGGDCVEFNAKYPECYVNDPFRVGDGVCDYDDDDDYYNTEKCGYDGGDCLISEKYPNCEVEDRSKIGNGVCDYGKYNTTECGYDGGDCTDFHLKYPDCDVDYPSWIGDGRCHIGYGIDYNTTECGYDGGDCIEYKNKYPDCDISSFPIYIGDGYCWNGDGFNTPECGYDGGDCEEFNSKYPSCTAERTWLLEDGFCDKEYNTTDCGYDGGDCLTLPSMTSRDDARQLKRDFFQNMFLYVLEKFYPQAEEDQMEWQQT